MSKKIIDVEDDVRDGIETLPEMMDVRAELAPVSKGAEAAIGGVNLECGDTEISPASDPLVFKRLE
jgi:hypothetical protein